MELKVGQEVRYTYMGRTFTCTVESLKGEVVGLRSYAGIGWVRLSDPRVTVENGSPARITYA